MFFILSKIFNFLMAPVSWMIILLLWMIISKSKHTKKKLFITIICISILFSNYFLYQQFALWWQPKPVTLEKGKHYSAGILLGGFAAFDKNKKGFFSENADRFIQAEKLYHQGFIQKIIMTGGSGSLIDNGAKEADFVKTELLACGVAEKDIIIENNSRNTFENAVFTKTIIDSLQLKSPFILITSAIHIPRSEKIFRKAGIAVIPFPTDFHVINSRLNWEEYIVPDLKLLNEWRYTIHEIIGIVAYKLTGKA
ncbi:MAG TPA: YdcF family protein [Chitinophagaceae bacterium]|nr:YdcF family protein [Chitinophagaceae bacterium]